MTIHQIREKIKYLRSIYKGNRFLLDALEDGIISKEEFKFCQNYRAQCAATFRLLRKSNS